MDWVSSRLLGAISGKRVVPSIPPGRSIVLESEDEDARSERRDGTAALSLFIEYVDASGAPSHRRIACRHYDGSVDTITAWCFEREAPRAFRVDRIAAAYCPETGELFDLDQLVFSLRRRGLPLSTTGLNVTLRLLTFLMRCDGVHAAEWPALEAAVTSFALRFDGDDEMVAQGLRMAKSLAPDENDFLRGLRWMRLRRDGPQLARFVRGQAGRIIDADGRHSDEEAILGIEIDRVLGAIEARSS